MIYITYNTNTNRVQQAYSKKPTVSGDLEIVEVEYEKLPKYDSTQEYLKVSDVRVAYETYTKQVPKTDEQGNICVNAETYEPIMVEIVDTRSYTTCDFIVAQDLKKVYQKEIKELETWFDVIYDNQVKQYQRCERLGIEYDNKYGTIESLDRQAHEKALRINELKKLMLQVQ